MLPLAIFPYRRIPAHNTGNALPLLMQCSSEEPADESSKTDLSTSLLWWWPELLAALCAVAAFAGIVGVAKHFRGHSIQETGLPSGLTLNGLIALLSTVARAALLIRLSSKPGGMALAG